MRSGFHPVVLEQADSLEPVGAGIQLSPNASRILVDLGLAESLAPHIVSPQEVRIMRAHNAREIARAQLDNSEFRYGAPYWLVHRGDLQTALLDRVVASRAATVHFGSRVEDFAVHANGITVQSRTQDGLRQEPGIAFVGADGLWSQVRNRIVGEAPPHFCGRSAWRATIDAELVPPEFREPITWLWLGANAHLVHYPIRGGKAVNLVAIMRDEWQAPGWSESADRADIEVRFSQWAADPRALLAIPDSWSKWALFDRPPLRNWSRGPVTLLGDAAHPMLPFLAQGGAMAIEDAAVLANALARSPDDAAAAFAAYEGVRRTRTARVARESQRNGLLYHLSGPAVLARNLALQRLSGDRLMQRYDWLYDWRAA